MVTPRLSTSKLRCSSSKKSYSSGQLGHSYNTFYPATSSQVPRRRAVRNGGVGGMGGTYHLLIRYPRPPVDFFKMTKFRSWINLHLSCQLYTQIQSSHAIHPIQDFGQPAGDVGLGTHGIKVFYRFHDFTIFIRDQEHSQCLASPSILALASPSSQPQAHIPQSHRTHSFAFLRIQKLGGARVVRLAGGR
jgi:hypothetical protein